MPENPDVLFVCSGNTCRSPMAQALFQEVCAQRGLPYTTDSAGLYARDGAAASDGAFFAMKERGLSLARHVAQSLTCSLASNARLVVTMGEPYRQQVLERCPWARVVAFDPPIGDPFGSDLALYRETANELASRMNWVLQQLENR